LGASFVLAQPARTLEVANASVASETNIFFFIVMLTSPF
jgi:hypothetical protein